MDEKTYNQLINFSEKLILNSRIKTPMEARDIVSDAFCINQNGTLEEYKKIITTIAFEYKNKFSDISYDDKFYIQKIKTKKSVNVTTKQCKDCKEIKSINEFVLNRARNSVGDIFTNQCKRCKYAKDLLYYYKNKGRNDIYRNSEKDKKCRKLWNEKNREKIRVQHRIRSKKYDSYQKEKMTDSYIKRLLRNDGINNNKITSKMIKDRRLKLIENKNRRQKKLKNS